MVKIQLYTEPCPSWTHKAQHCLGRSQNDRVGQAGRGQRGSAEVMMSFVAFSWTIREPGATHVLMSAVETLNRKRKTSGIFLLNLYWWEP